MLDFSRVNEWILAESSFDPDEQGKVEANFCLGNGYLGLRSATEENYLGQTRDLLVAGTFDCSDFRPNPKLQPRTEPENRLAYPYGEMGIAERCRILPAL